MPGPRAGFYLLGLEKTVAKLAAMKAVEQKKREVAVKIACVHLERSIKQKFLDTTTGLHIAQHTGYGRQYKVSETGKWHTASAPGQPPAVLTGRLRASITHNVENKPKVHTYSHKEGSDTTTLPPSGGTKTRTVGLVGTDVIYGKSLEFGNPASNLLPRPYIFPTLGEQRNRIAAILRAGARIK